MSSGRNTRAAEVAPSVVVPVPEVEVLVSGAMGVGTNSALQKSLLLQQ